MKILTRDDEIKEILAKKINEENIIDIILKQEKEMIVQESLMYHLSHSPMYGYADQHYFCSLKKHKHILYGHDYQLMNHIRNMNGSLINVRKEIGERIWGKYLNTLRF